MLFNSLDYFLFLALTLAGFWVVRYVGPEAQGKPGRAGARGSWLRLLLVFVASCVFYMSWNAKFIVLILGSAVLDYNVGRWIAKPAAD